MMGEAHELKNQKIPIVILVWLILGCPGCSTINGQKNPPVTTSTPTASAALGDLRVRATDGMGMVYVPEGKFMMGSDYQATAYARKLCRQYYGNDASAACTAANFGDESPAHAVTLKGFWIDTTEVTNQQYQKCEQDSACTPPEADSYYHSAHYEDPEYSDYPVTWITRDQASQYCLWSGGRLPTEAEWEYAARGPESRIFPWGDSFDGSRLNFCDVNCEAGRNDTSYNDGYPETAPVGSFPSGASWVGALDMAGNVREWVADWYGFYTADPLVNPTGPATGETVIPHGGSWMDLPCLIRSANRGGDPPEYSRHNVGFRCVMDNWQEEP